MVIKWVMLTGALRAQVKNLKIEIKNKFHIESIIFATFKTLNIHFKKNLLHLSFIFTFKTLKVMPRGHNSSSLL